MPHFLNDPNNAVIEAIEGLCLERHQTIQPLPNCSHVIALKEVSKTNVAIISGGGSGHEPMHGGFVAPGMLSAAVCGRVFASPPISHVRAAIDYLIASGAPSVLVMVKRYTGDILNFGAAVEASAQRYGSDKVAMVVIGDDVTFGPCDEAARGLAGTVLWYRMVSAAASAAGPSPLNLRQLQQLADICAAHIRSMGASLQSCTLPAATAPNAAIKEGEVEIGLGIHGERGSTSVTFSHDADGLAQTLLKQILNPTTVDATEANQNIESSWLSNQPPELLLYINNLGGTTGLEMAVMARSFLKALSGAKARLVGTGAICTSLDMHGISITAINLSQLADALQSVEGLGHLAAVEALEGLLLTVNKGASSLGITSAPPTATISALTTSGTDLGEQRTKSTDSLKAVSPEAAALLKALVSSLEKLKGRSEAYNQFDAACGDGDTGTGVAAAAEALLAQDASILIPLARNLTTAGASPANLSIDFVNVGNIICDNMAGSLGALLAIYLSGMTASLPADAGASAEGSSVFEALMSSPRAVASALRGGAAAVKRVIGTVPGDRTFIDITEAVAASLEGDGPTKPLAEVLKEVTASVSQMKARKGRARYLGGKEVGHRDPGAEVVADFIDTFLTQLGTA